MRLSRCASCGTSPAHCCASISGARTIRGVSRAPRDSGRSFAAADETLRVAELNVPFGIVDFPPPSLLEPALAHVRSRATPGRVRVVQVTRRAIVPTAAWSAALPGAMLVVFADYVLEPSSAFESSTARTDWIRVSDDVVFGVEADGRLGAVLVEGALARME